MARKWAGWLHNPCCLGVPTASKQGAQSKVAHKWAAWLNNPCRLGGLEALEIGQNQRCPTSRMGGYITFAAWGVPTASERGAESEVAHKWAGWLHNPCFQGGAHRFRARGKITPAALGGANRFRGGPNDRVPTSGRVATQPLPRGGSQLLQRGAQR